MPLPTTIYGASKLTGRLAEGWTVGTLQALTAPTTDTGGTVLGITYTGMSTETVAAVDSFTWEGPTGANAITVADGGLGILISDEDTGTSVTTTLSIDIPTTELMIATGTGANTVTIGDLSAFTGELDLIGGGGQDTLYGPQSATAWLPGPAPAPPRPRCRSAGRPPTSSATPTS